jgi:hypothetical protein
MSTKERLKTRLVKSRAFLDRLLADFKTPQQWTHQVHDRSNHALWVAGHLTTVDNFFTMLVAPEKSKDLPGYNEKFGMGSQPTGNPADYPTAEEVLGHLRERRETLVSILDAMDDAQLAEKMPDGSPDFFTDKASAFEMAAWHEGMHSGQVTVVRQSLGFPRLISPPKA